MSASAFDAALRAVVEEALAPLRAEVADLRARLDGSRGRYVSPAAAAERLGLSVPTIRRYLRDGLLKHTRVRRRVLVDVASLPDARGLAARARTRLRVTDHEEEK